jgi:fido (protein-threonine AMPylation protein)
MAIHRPAERRLGLIPSYITLRQELNELADQYTEGERWAFGRRDILDESFLRELHRRMFAQV